MWRRRFACSLLVALALLSFATAATAQFSNGQAAVGVLGPGDLVTRPAGAATDSRFNGPNGVALDPTSGKLFVADRGNHRVLRWSGTEAMLNGSAAEAVLGQPDFTTATSGLSAVRMNNPIGVHVDAAGRLWVGDYGNNRVLRFDDAANKPSGATADGVLGQPDFTTSGAATSAVKMNGPVGLTTDAAGRLWVSNFGNHRVLRFDDAAGKPNGAAADGVIGQLDFTTGTSGLTQAKLNNPNSVYVDAGGRLWVSDYTNRRVLRFDGAANKADGAPADGVLGKPDFTTGGSQVTQAGFGTTRFVDGGSDGTLYVVEEANHRIMVFLNAASLANGAPADFVLGQAGFTTNAGPNPPTATSLATPRASIVDDANGRLWVADWANNRVLRYEFATGSDPVVSLAAPNGGETWTIGAVHTIAWNSANVASLDIEYSTDDGASWLPVAGGVAAGGGSYAWTVPDAPTTSARVRVTDSADPAVTDQSAGAFTIAAPIYAVTVLSPNGGQRWQTGSQAEVMFTTTNVADVMIELSSDDGASWAPLAGPVPAAIGAWTWTVPELAGEGFRVRVSDAGSSGAVDASDASFALVPEITGDEFDYVFFSDSPTAGYYDPSWTTVTAPSSLARVGEKMPVTLERSLVGNYALKLEWTSAVGGNWGAAVAGAGWVGRDVTQRDSLIVNVFTEATVAQADLPCLYLEDTSNAKSAKIPLSTLTGDVVGGAWRRLAIPVQVFIDNPGLADLTRIKTVFFGQQDADGSPHRWFLDDIRMTGGTTLTGDDVPTIVVIGSSTAAGTGASSPAASWVGRLRTWLQAGEPTSQVVNLAVGGYTTYHVLPTGTTPPAGRPSPAPENNITRALAYKPWLIVVNLPSNDVTNGYATAEIMANYATLQALAAAAEVPIWFTTTQPRNLPQQAQRDQQAAIADLTLATYGSYGIDVWNGLAAADGRILVQFDAGDGIHLNDLGHTLIYERVLGAIWAYLGPLSAEGPVDGGEGTGVPRATRLFQNAPNPFNPSTVIAFDLARAGTVRLEVYDLGGRRVRTLVSGPLPAQRHRVAWDGLGDDGRSLPSGAYLYRLDTGLQVQTQRMMLVK
ncbi:MAG: hypothetical protein IPK64_12650 [bacterium]|nr:hypothetical protein [bacterium]